jgi:hypothetical protein
VALHGQDEDVVEKSGPQALLCFVLMPIRADEERIGGTIHKPMFERLMLCPYAIADITGAKPNVYYELGIRHAMRPRSTVILVAAGTMLPFDIALLRGVPYRTNDLGVPADPAACAGTIARQLREAKDNPHDDSPLYQLLEYMPRHEGDHSKTDIFRERLDCSQKYKERLAAAREQGADAVNTIVADPALANLLDVEAGVVVDMFLSLLDVQAYAGMIDLYNRMRSRCSALAWCASSSPLRSTVRNERRKRRTCFGA